MTIVFILVDAVGAANCVSTGPVIVADVVVELQLRMAFLGRNQAENGPRAASNRHRYLLQPQDLERRSQMLLAIDVGVVDRADTDNEK